MKTTENDKNCYKLENNITSGSVEYQTIESNDLLLRPA